MCAFYILNMAKVHAQDKKDSLVNVAFGSVQKADLLGAVSTVNVPELLKKNYSTYSLDGLQSLVSGYNGNIWGQSVLILVDGVPRSVYDVQSSEIESITVLKGASAVVLYGSKAAKGVVLITTKTGKAQPLSINVRANTGVYVPKAYPKYLNAADYMTLYNEAYINDGLASTTKPVYYSQETIDNTAAGTNPFRYPDIDFYSSDYLRNFISKTEATGEITGGNQFATYYTNFNVSNNNSLLKFGDHKDDKDFEFNMRANVNMNLTKWLKASSHAVAQFADNFTARGNFWGTAATLRPNWYSPLIPVSKLDLTNATIQSYLKNTDHLIDGQYLLGGTSTDLTNAFADGYAAGYIKNKNRTFMFDVKVDAELNSIIKGLSFSAMYGLDYRDFYSEAYSRTYAVYKPTWTTGTDGTETITDLVKYNNDSHSANEVVGSTNYTQTNTFSTQFNYKRTFGMDHNVTAALIGWGYQIQSSADLDNQSTNTQTQINTYYHRNSNLNLGIQAAYNYKQKYYVDFSGAVVHSSKLPEGGRDAFSPSVTLGWRLSNENFFKNNVSFVDNLKLTASYASLNQDIDISQHYMYLEYYSNKAGWYQWRDNVAGGNTSASVQGGNNALTFIQRKEFRAGLETSMFNNLISLDVNYFNQNTDGLLTKGSATIYPSYYTAYSPYINYAKDNRTGVDFALNLNKKLGEVDASLGIVGMYFTSKAVRRDEVYSDAYQYTAGKPLDAYWGYVCDGFFNNQDEIDNHAKQTFGTVKPGDLKYRDLNGDNIIDSKDTKNLGHNGWSVTPLTLGVNLTLKWKNFTLFAMGTANSGGIGFKNSSYYWVTGDNKYSEVVLGRWTENTKDVATYPRLSTQSNSNNFRNSTFWMYKTDRFDLTKIQITYDLPESIFKNSFVRSFSVYVNGGSLLTISKERELMETNIGSSPQYRNFNLGFKASF